MGTSQTWIPAIHAGMTAYFNSMVSPAPPPFLELLHKLVPNPLAMPGQIIRHVRVAPVVGFVLGQKLDDQRRRLRLGRVQLGQFGGLVGIAGDFCSWGSGFVASMLKFRQCKAQCYTDLFR